MPACLAHPTMASTRGRTCSGAVARGRCPGAGVGVRNPYAVPVKPVGNASQFGRRGKQLPRWRPSGHPPSPAICHSAVWQSQVLKTISGMVVQPWQSQTHPSSEIGKSQRSFAFGEKYDFIQQELATANAYENSNVALGWYRLGTQPGCPNGSSQGKHDLTKQMGETSPVTRNYLSLCKKLKKNQMDE